MKRILPVFLVGPFVLALGVITAMCQSWFPTANACPAAEEWWPVFLSYLIMFAIAVWVGGVLTYMLLRARDGAPGPDED